MRLAKRISGVSKLLLLLLLLICFVLGATLSYVFTIGFYAPGEFNLPKDPIIAIEGTPGFFPENATFFNITVLNPSYSPSNVTIDKIEVETEDGQLHAATSPSLKTNIPIGSSQTFQAFWNWGNYTGQSLRVHVIPLEGIGSNIKATTPFMNLSITRVDLNPSVSAERFNITVQNVGSSSLVNLTKVLVNSVQAETEPSLSAVAGLANAPGSPPVELVVKRNWADFQGKELTIGVQTMQGYAAYRTTVPPGPVTLSIDPRLVVFNTTYTDHFNMSILNGKSISAYVNITQVNIDVYMNGQINRTVTLNSSSWVADPSATIDLSVPLSITRFKCYWDWNSYIGTGATATMTARTLQGFQTSPASEISIP